MSSANLKLVRRSDADSPRATPYRFFTQFVCAPFIAYSCELANENNITIQLNTTASGHGKWMHDQLGATVSKFIRNAIATNKIKFKPNESIARKIVEYLNIHFKTSKDDTITHYFYEIPVSDVKVHASPVNALKIGNEGISEYHCCIIKLGNAIKFRRYSCMCGSCINTDFGTDCPQSKYCGRWFDCIPSKYPKYAEAKHNPKKKQAKKANKTRPSKVITKHF